MGKIIYETKGKASEYAKYGFSAYLGCSAGCSYCYNKKGRFAKTLGGNKPTLKKCFKDETDAIEIFIDEISVNIVELQKHGLFFSFTTDPMLPETYDLTMNAAGIAVNYGIPVKILTKCASWVDSFLECINKSNSDNEDLEWRKEYAFGFTLTGHDNLEPNASTNIERITAMRKLHEAGFRTWASIEPIVDFYESEKMISKTRGFCDLYKVGLMSGKKYDKLECWNFVARLSFFSSLSGRFYFKDSILKQAGISREELPENCVGRDYNMFK